VLQLEGHVLIVVIRIWGALAENFGVRDGCPRRAQAVPALAGGGRRPC